MRSNRSVNRTHNGVVVLGLLRIPASPLRAGYVQR